MAPGQRKRADVDEQQALIAQLEETREVFEQQTQQAMAGDATDPPLTMQLLRVLAHVALGQGRGTSHQVAEHLQVSLATVSGIVDRLVDHGVVQRTEDPQDRRVRRLGITPRGQELISSLHNHAGSMPIELLEAMPVDDLRALVRGILALQRAAREVGERQVGAGQKGTT